MLIFVGSDYSGGRQFHVHLPTNATSDDLLSAIQAHESLTPGTFGLHHAETDLPLVPHSPLSLQALGDLSTVHLFIFADLQARERAKRLAFEAEAKRRGRYIAKDGKERLRRRTRKELAEKRRREGERIPGFKVLLDHADGGRKGKVYGVRKGKGGRAPGKEKESGREGSSALASLIGQSGEHEDQAGYEKSDTVPTRSRRKDKGRGRPRGTRPTNATTASTATSSTLLPDQSRSGLLTTTPLTRRSDRARSDFDEASTPISAGFRSAPLDSSMSMSTGSSSSSTPPFAFSSSPLSALPLSSQRMSLVTLVDDGHHELRHGEIPRLGRSPGSPRITGMYDQYTTATATTSRLPSNAPFPQHPPHLSHFPPAYRATGIAPTARSAPRPTFQQYVRDEEGENEGRVEPWDMAPYHWIGR